MPSIKRGKVSGSQTVGWMDEGVDGQMDGERAEWEGGNRERCLQGCGGV